MIVQKREVEVEVSQDPITGAYIVNAPNGVQWVFGKQKRAIDRAHEIAREMAEETLREV